MMVNTDEFKQFFTERDKAVPLYLHLADFLKQKILSGAYAEGTRFPAETELADMLGVHRITLRKSLKIFSSQNLITQTPRLGTFVASRKQKKIRIGIVYDCRFSGNYMMNLMFEIERAMALYPGTEQVFIPLVADDDQTNCKKIEDAGCDAMLVPFSREYIFHFFNQKKYDLLPVVFINHYCRELTGMRYSVSLDTDAIRVGIDFLKSRGHKRIAYFTSDSGNLTLTLRNQAFQKYLSDDLFMFVCEEKSLCYEFIKAKVQELCRSENPPTAFLTPGTFYTSSVWHGILESGLKIPDDISVLGFDPMPDTYPIASTLDQPVAEMAEKAVALLQELCSGRTFRRHLHLYKASVSDRGSVKQISPVRKKRGKQNSC